ncbi:MAG: magnesium transporter CorA family protein [Anaerolineae bacterium]|nr:magnesium transporter CorA family protein [Anaerolineae bacterium]
MMRSLVAFKDAVLDDDFMPGRNLSQEKLEHALQNGDTVWIDVVDAPEEEIRWLEQQLGLHPLVVADLLREDRRPALQVLTKYMFLSLFQPEIRLNKVRGMEIHCLIGANYFITIRPERATAVDEAYNRVAQTVGPWKTGPSHFLYLTIQHVIDSYYPQLDRISNQLNRQEEVLLQNGINESSRKPIYTIKQQLINLRQMVAPQREVLSNAVGEERIAANPEIRDLFRHLYERLLRIYDVVDTQRDLASNVLDMIDSREANKLSETVGRLTILSMIFLPLTFFTGLFQLNFATTTDQLQLPISGGAMFIGVMVLMIASVLFMGVYFRRHGWL